MDDDLRSFSDHRRFYVFLAVLGAGGAPLRRRLDYSLNSDRIKFSFLRGIGLCFLVLNYFTGDRIPNLAQLTRIQRLTFNIGKLFKKLLIGLGFNLF